MIASRRAAAAVATQVGDAAELIPTDNVVMSRTALIVDTDARRAKALAGWLHGVGLATRRCDDDEAAVASLRVGERAAWLAIDLDAGAETLTLLRSHRCTQVLPPLLALARGADAARTADALADGAALVLDWATPAEMVRQVLQAAPLPPVGDTWLAADAAGWPGGAASLEARIGFAQAIEQQGRELLFRAVHGSLAGRYDAATQATARLAQLAADLAAPGLARACAQLARDRGTGLLMQQRAARVRQELDAVACALGRAALEAPRPQRDGESDGWARRAD